MRLPESTRMASQLAPVKESPLRLQALVLSEEHMALRTAARRRQWMDQSPQRFAYRCLPLVIANQIGWEILCPVDVAAVWTGSPEVNGVRLRFRDKKSSLISAHFGSGVLTFTPGYLFRTPPGHNLWCMGPANEPRDGIMPLEGVIETDWATATFTMNWKFTRANQAVLFKAGEPICRIVPIPRGYVQSFAPEIRAIQDEPDTFKAYEEWRRSREKFLDGLHKREPETVEKGWQRDYVAGRHAGGQSADEHETKLPVKPFVDRRKR